MNWVFFDALKWDYDVSTPLVQPMGGSQSAMCYLATALARRGHSVATITGIPSPREILGVRCYSHSKIPFDLFAAPGTLTVIINGPADLAGHLRQSCPHHLFLVLWTQHAPDQPSMEPLRELACAALWDRIVCVSDWQRAALHERLGVSLEQMDVLRNAVAPAFEGMFRDPAELASAKSQSLRLAYTSIPYRGLDVLLSCFPRLRQKHPACHLDIFSSMLVYGDLPHQDEHQHLYAQCRATQGINYRGSVPQPDLAQELTGVSVLAYPNTFPETSCIAVMEALAAGALVVTSDLGALPETCSGWARLVTPVYREQFELDFEDALNRALIEMQSNLPAFHARRFEQAKAITTECTWDVRAAQWEEAALRWTNQHG
jgi:glycosyltransferase involved in cell wall biosynthesis